LLPTRQDLNVTNCCRVGKIWMLKIVAESARFDCYKLLPTRQDLNAKYCCELGNIEITCFWPQNFQNNKIYFSIITVVD
jgi:hypothetical protein